MVPNASSREAEGVNGPGEVTVPVGAAEGESFTDGRLVDLDGVNTGLLEVQDLTRRARASCLD